MSRSLKESYPMELAQYADDKYILESSLSPLLGTTCSEEGTRSLGFKDLATSISIGWPEWQHLKRARCNQKRNGKYHRLRWLCLMRWSSWSSFWSRVHGFYHECIICVWNVCSVRCWYFATCPVVEQFCSTGTDFSFLEAIYSKKTKSVPWNRFFLRSVPKFDW